MQPTQTSFSNEESEERAVSRVSNRGAGLAGYSVAGASTDLEIEYHTSVLKLGVLKVLN